MRRIKKRSINTISIKRDVYVGNVDDKEEIKEEIVEETVNITPEKVTLEERTEPVCADVAADVENSVEEAETEAEEAEEKAEAEEVEETETAEAAEDTAEAVEEVTEEVEEVPLEASEEESEEILDEEGSLDGTEEEARALAEEAQAVEDEAPAAEETAAEDEAAEEVIAEEIEEAEEVEEPEEAEEVEETAEDAAEETEAAEEEKPAEKPEKEAFKLTAPANQDDILSKICVKRGRKLIYRPNEIIFNCTAAVIGTDKDNEEGIKVKNILDEEIKQGVKLGYIDKYDGLKMSEIKEEYENDVVYEYAEQEFKRVGLVLEGEKVKVYVYDWDMKALHHIGFVDQANVADLKPYLENRDKYSFDVCGLITGGKFRKVVKDEATGKITVEKGNDGKLGVELDISIVDRKD